MRVRVHKRDFTYEDYENVREIYESFGDFVIKDGDYEELARFENHQFHSIEIRPNY